MTKFKTCKHKDCKKKHHGKGECQKHYLIRYNKSPKGRENRRKYLQSPKGIETIKGYQQTEKYKEYQKGYKQTERYKESQRKYRQTEKYKENRRKYMRNRYQTDPEFREKVKKANRKRGKFKDDTKI